LTRARQFQLPRGRVRRALQEGWDTHANGKLLRVAEAAGFDVLLTTDNNIAYQQNLERRQIAIVALAATGGGWWRRIVISWEQPLLKYKLRRGLHGAARPP